MFMARRGEAVALGTVTLSPSVTRFLAKVQVANAYRVTVGEFVTECRHPTGVYDWIHLAAPTATA
jgi:hypothetical protein